MSSPVTILNGPHAGLGIIGLSFFVLCFVMALNQPCLPGRQGF